MQKSKKLHNFYRSKKWQRLRDYIYFNRNNSKCENCDILLGKGDFNVHHIIELTDDNVDDPTISLNDDLLKLLCLGCHNLEHNRFKKNENRVEFDEKGYIIWG